MGLTGPIGKLGGYSELIMFALVFFMWGTAGIPMIVRKEGLLDVGGRAVLFGIVHLVIGWGIAFFLMVYNILFR
jgi:hypothetical protein